MKMTITLRNRTASADAVSFRLPMPVTERLTFRNGGGFPICPRCDVSMEREYMRFCDRCGQRLNWRDFDNAKVRYIYPCVTDQPPLM